MTNVAVVTGAASGIGLSVSKRLLYEHYHVLALDRDERKLQKLQEEVDHPNLNTVNCDVAKKTQADTVIKNYGDKMGHIDVLFNGVGQMTLGCFSELSEKDWDRSITLNIKTVMYCIDASFKYLKMSDNANIISLSSVLGETHEHAALSYTTTKSMLEYFTKSLAKDFTKDGIRVNCIQPGPIQTQFMNHLVKEAKRKQGGKELLMRLSTTPLRRLGEKEEIADTVLYIVSTRFITGSILKLDGGWSL